MRVGVRLRVGLAGQTMAKRGKGAASWTGRVRLPNGVDCTPYAARLQALAARMARAGQIAPAGKGAGEWYAVFGRADAAVKRLAELKIMGCAPHCQLFVPKRRFTITAKSKKRVCEVSLFGAYFFAHLDLDWLPLRAGEVRRARESGAAIRLQALRDLDGIVSVLGNDGEGWPLPVTAWKGFAQLLAEPVKVQQTRVLVKDERMRITQGPFVNHEGTFERLLGRVDNVQRVIIMAQLLGGSVPVEVKIEHVEAVV